MSRPKGFFHPEYTRTKIRTSVLLDLLHRHAEGKAELSLSRIRAIDILLRKVITVTSDITHRYVAELPPVLSKEERRGATGHNGNCCSLRWRPRRRKNRRNFSANNSGYGLRLKHLRNELVTVLSLADV
jgi:hypothetical protein